MAAIEAIKIASAALWANRLRSILTLLGVVIGVMSVITIISAIEGVMQGFEDEVNALGPSTFIITKFGIIRSDEEYFKALKRKNLTMDDAKAIERGCPDCEEVAGRAYMRGNVKRGNLGLQQVIIGGSTPNLLRIVDFQVAEGRYFVESEYEKKMHVAFIGPTLVDELFPGLDPIGRTLKIKGQIFTVIGVAKKRGSFLGNNQDNFAMIPLTTHIKLFGKPKQNFNLVIKSATVDGILDTEDQVRAILRARRGVAYRADDDFSILTADNILAFINNITRFARIALIGISSIALVVGGIVIMNIMMVSVSERTREIGIRKSIGARRRNIRDQFLFESLILSLGGGMIGTALGIGIAVFLGSKISLHVTPSIFAICAGMAISTGVGLFFGIYPAMKAAKLDPIAALRSE